VVAPGNDALFQALRAFRAQLIRRRALVAVGTLLPILLATGALAALFLYWAGIPLPSWEAVLLTELTFLLVGLVFHLARHWPSLEQTARLFDHFAETDDRSHTALIFAQNDKSAPLQQLAIHECQSYLANQTNPVLPPIRPSLAWLWLPPLISLAAIYLWADQPESRLPAPEPPPSEIETLSQLNEELANPDSQTPESLEKLAESLDAELEKLAETELSDQNRKALLQEAATLEELLRQLQQAANPKRFSPEELKALANALQSQSPELAESLQNGDLQEAARELERLMNQIANQPDPKRTLSELAQSLQEELNRLDESEKSALTQQMQQAAELAASEEMAELRQKMREIAQMLQQQGAAGGGQQGRPQPGGPGGSSGGMPQTRESLQQMLDALDRLKEQLQNQEGGEPGQNASGQNPGMGQQEVPFGLPMPGMGDQNGNSGPGSEFDQGSTESETGELTTTSTPEGPAKMAQGEQNAGESSVEMIESAGDNSRAAAEYKAVYEALESERTEAIYREEIPIGSRLYLKRYFESIRPNY